MGRDRGIQSTTMKQWLVAVLAAATMLVVVSAQPARRRVSLIVSGGTVITQNAAHRILAPGALAIDGTTIVDVDTPAAIASKYQAADTLDARGQLVLPGLINTHTHAPMVMYRGLADDLALMDWLQKYIFPAEATTVSPEFVRVGTRLAAVEMIESGTTTFVDMVPLRGRDSEGDRRGRTARRAGRDDHPVPCARCKDAGGRPGPGRALRLPSQPGERSRAGTWSLPRTR